MTTSVVVLVDSGATVVEELGGLGTGELVLLDVEADEGAVDDVDDVDNVVLEAGGHLVQR